MLWSWWRIGIWRCAQAIPCVGRILVTVAATVMAIAAENGGGGGIWSKTEKKTQKLKIEQLTTLFCLKELTNDKRRVLIMQSGDHQVNRSCRNRWGREQHYLRRAKRKYTKRKKGCSQNKKIFLNSWQLYIQIKLDANCFDRNCFPYLSQIDFLQLSTIAGRQSVEEYRIRVWQITVQGLKKSFLFQQDNFAWSFYCYCP